MKMKMIKLSNMNFKIIMHNVLKKMKCKTKNVRIQNQKLQIRQTNVPKLKNIMTEIKNSMN